MNEKCSSHFSVSKEIYVHVYLNSHLFSIFNLPKSSEFEQSYLSNLTKFSFTPLSDAEPKVFFGCFNQWLN